MVVNERTAALFRLAAYIQCCSPLPEIKRGGDILLQILFRPVQCILSLPACGLIMIALLLLFQLSASYTALISLNSDTYPPAFPPTYLSTYLAIPITYICIYTIIVRLIKCGFGDLLKTKQLENLLVELLSGQVTGITDMSLSCHNYHSGHMCTTSLAQLSAHITTLIHPG